MDIKDQDSRRSSMANNMLHVNSKKLSQISNNSNGICDMQQLRRPFGVAAIDLTPIIRKPDDFKNNLDMPFVLFEKENLDISLKKLILNKEFGKTDSKLVISVELLHGDVKQVSKLNLFFLLLKQPLVVYVTIMIWCSL